MLIGAGSPASGLNAQTTVRRLSGNRHHALRGKHMRITKHGRARMLATLFVAVASLTGALAACGSDDDSSGGAPSTAGNGIDRAFVADMIPHHESAVEMAKIAEDRGQRTFVTELAGDIISSQTSEISKMRVIASRLDDAGVKPESLGESQMGMGGDVSELKTAKPFDRAFIDMMIPHHQEAIRMARVELAKGSNAQAKQLATQIIAAQTKEINAMNKHRTAEFGGPSPAGGVPAEGGKEEAKDGAMQGMDQG